MILGDFLSRQQVGESDLHEIIPILFNMKESLKQKYYKLRKTNFWYRLDPKLRLPERQQSGIIRLGLGKVELESEKK